MDKYVKMPGNIFLGRGLIRRAGELLDLDRRALIVTDSLVPRDYARAVAAQCQDPLVVTIPSGEGSKCFDRLEELIGAMLEAGFARGDCAVAVGGGVCGDLAGFAASCYMRGIDFYNVPTTFLSQVDSSVGGKTAIDFHGVKNLVGAFYPAKGVLIDPELLGTLPPRQMRSGLAESIKMAAALDAQLFEMIERAGGLEADFSEIIARSVRDKIKVVEADPREGNLRRVLNFGHTIGHAIESRYEGKLLHGECVALGMLPMAEGEARERIRALLEQFGMRTRADAAPSELIGYLAHDKKALGGKVRVVLVERIGSFAFRDMTAEEILSRMEGAQ